MRAATASCNRCAGSSERELYVPAVPVPELVLVDAFETRSAHEASLAIAPDALAIAPSSCGPANQHSRRARIRIA